MVDADGLLVEDQVVDAAVVELRDGERKDGEPDGDDAAPPRDRENEGDAPGQVLRREDLAREPEHDRRREGRAGKALDPTNY